MLFFCLEPALRYYPSTFGYLVHCRVLSSAAFIGLFGKLSDSPTYRAGGGSVAWMCSLSSLSYWLSWIGRPVLLLPFRFSILKKYGEVGRFGVGLGIAGYGYSRNGRFRKDGGKVKAHGAVTSNLHSCFEVGCRFPYRVRC